MNTSFWIAAISLPLIGGMHRFAVSYGYRGVSRWQAVGEAYRVALMLAVISALFVCAHLVAPQPS